MIEGEGDSSRPESKKFEGSWLLPDQKELEDLTPESFKKRIKLLHEAARSEVLSPENWREEYLDIVRKTSEGEYSEEEVAGFLARITGRLEKFRKEEKPIGKEGDAPISTKEILNQLQKNFGLLPQAFAERMGAIAPEQVLEAYRRAEESIVPFMIGPGQEPPFFVLYRGEAELEYQRKLWEARSVLVQAAAHKLKATAIEGRQGQPGLIDNDNMAIELNKIRLEILFRLPGVLPSLSIYTRIIGEEFSKDKPLPDLRSVLLGDKDDIKNLGLPKEETKAFLEEQIKLRKSCPERIWKARQDTFLEMRKSIRFWLKIKGRDLLFRNKQEEQGFIKSGRDIKQIVEDRARDGEQIAWNLIFTSGLIESFNSRGEREINTSNPYLPPSNFMTLFLSMLLHPQERLEAKVLRKDPVSKNFVLPKEEWSAFGTWIINNIRKGNWRVKGPNDKERVEIPRIFEEDKIIKDAFRQGKKNHQKIFFDDPKKWGETFLMEKGHKSVSDAETLTREFISDDPKKLEKGWGKLGDAPFVNYRFDHLKWANTVFSVFKKGATKDVSLQNLAEAVRMLELPRQDRENLLIAWVGVDPNSASRKPQPAMGKIDFAVYKQELKRLEPTYFVGAPKRGKKA